MDGALTAKQRTANLSIFLYKSILCCWLIGCVGSIVRLLLANQLLVRVDSQNVHYCDYVLYQMAGRIFASATPEKIYDSATQMSNLNALVAPAHLERVDLLLYPPYFFALMSPFAARPLVPAYIIWTLIGTVLSLVVSFLLAKKANRLKTKSDQIMFIVGAAIFLPFFQSAQVGYSSLLLLFFVGAYFYCWLDRRDFLAGMALAFSAIKVQYLLLLILPAIVCKRFKLAGTAILSVAIFCGLSLMRVGLPCFLQYPAAVKTWEPIGNIYQMVNIRGLLSQFLPQSTAVPISTFASLFGIAAILFIWFVERRFHSRLSAEPGEGESGSHSQNVELWAISLTVVCALLFGPHAQMSDCTLLIVPAALTLHTLDLFKVLRMPDMALKLWHLIWLVSPALSIGLYIWWSVFNQWMSMRLDPFLLYNLALFAAGSWYYRSLFRPRNRIGVPPAG